jgi:pyruvate kinase
MTQAKIVATLGPASESLDVIRALIEAGADVFRVNFSHGGPDDHRRLARAVRTVAGEMGREVALLGDVAGPRLRCGQISPEPVQLESGRQVTLTTEAVVGSESLIPVNYGHLHEDVRLGQEIALDDGRIRLRVEAIEGRGVVCRIVEGGPLRSHKGLNLPETTLQIAAITDDDRQSIAVAVEEGFDFLGLSFVASAADVAMARTIVQQQGGAIALIAKIERRSAVEQLEEILDAADGAMVARGDLGVELPLERVPLVQKRVIRACNVRAKPVITATQMLESMIHSHRPTRAEVTDIANAVLDGTDAVMLSGETAVGEFPVEAVRAMDRVAKAADEALDRENCLRRDSATLPSDNDSAMAQAASQLAFDLKTDAIVCLTEGGSTARRIARHRPLCPILAVTTNLATARRLLLSWGVEPIFLPAMTNLPPPAAASTAGGDRHDQPQIGSWINRMLPLCVRAGRLQPGQRVVIVAGLPLGRPGITNLIHLATVPPANET